MVLLASAGLSLSWPRMKLGQENPFQNAPGPFIYALPNLAGSTCPFSCSDTVLFGGAFSGDTINASSSSPSSSPDPLHQCRHTYHRCQHDPPSESAELQAAATSTSSTRKEEDVQDGQSTESSSSLSPTDESHFGLDEVISISSPPLTLAAEEGGIEQAEAEQQQRESEASETFTVPPTPTDSNSNTRTDSDSPGVSGSKEEEGGEERIKKKGARRRRKRNGRSRSERGVAPIPPRFMGLSGIHYYGLWTQYGLCPQAPPPPPAVNHHVWPFAAYHHHPSHHLDHSTGGFVVPPNSPAPQLWNPMVPAPSFVVGVPVASC